MDPAPSWRPHAASHSFVFLIAFNNSIVPWRTSQTYFI